MYGKNISVPYEGPGDAGDPPGDLIQLVRNLRDCGPDDDELAAAINALINWLDDFEGERE